MERRGDRLLSVRPEEVIAPCKPGGKVITIDDDTKDGFCICDSKPDGCLVDKHNRVIGDNVGSYK